MELLKLEINYLTDIMKVVFLTLLVAFIFGLIFKTKINIFEKYLLMFKVVFYLLLALLTFSLNVTIVDEETKVNFGIPKELTIGQSILILISALEALSNLFMLFKMPKSEFHLVQKKDLDKYKTREMIKKIEILQRIGNLEKELEIIKNNRTKMKRKKRKKKGEEKNNKTSEDKVD